VTIIDTIPEDDVEEAWPPTREQFVAMLIDASKLAVEEAASKTPTTTYRPASVDGVDPALRTASVLCDGDTTAITAQLLTELPGQGDRVMVEFRAAGAVFVAGFITSCGTPPGTLAPYAGAISNHAGAVSGSATPGEPPRGWLWCAGQAVSRSTYAALYLAVGDAWGAGDGATTFNVPDFRGRDFRGIDNMGGSDAGRIGAANTLGGTGGTGTISTAMLPSHTHSFSATTGNQSANHVHDMNDVYNQGGLYTSGTNGGGSGNTINGVSTRTTAGVSVDHTHTVSGTSGGAGSGSEFLPPYALVHIIVKA
jgi:microcystin-dependent protein